MVPSARPTMPMIDLQSLASRVSSSSTDLGASPNRGTSQDSAGEEPSHSPIVVATAREVKGTGAFSFSVADSFMPADTFREETSREGQTSTSAGSQFPMALQALAQAQLWLTCAGGIMVAFALNRARAVLAYYAHQNSQAKEGSTSFVSWRIDPDMVRSSAWNSAG